MVSEAIDSQVSAIQIRLEGSRMVIYHHREGGYHPQETLPGYYFPPVTTRYKLLADVDLLNRRYPLKGQFSVVNGGRHYSIGVTWEDPQHDPTVTLSIEAGAEADVEEDDRE